MTTHRSQIARRRRVALTALREYPLPEGTLRFVSHGENTTFRHESAVGRFLVRVHRQQRHGRDVDPGVAIASEIAWLRAVRDSTNLDVPEALPASDGRVVVAVEAGDEVWQCSVLRWMPGRIFESTAGPRRLARLGEAMALLHRQADAWTPPGWFTRIRWDHETFFGDVMVYGGVRSADCWDLFPADLRRRFEGVRDRMLPLFEADPDTRLIHADLHLGNAVFEGDRVKLIDFDDCGFGPRIYDVAVALWELRDLDGYPQVHDALLAGYRSVRDIDTTHLDEHIALRQFAFQIWYTGQAQANPAFAERLDRVERWSRSMLDLLGV